MSDPCDKLQFILARRSVRVYSPGEVGEDRVRAMLEAAMAAPSAMTKDPWRFVVIRNRETLAKLPAMLPGGGMLSTAAMGILVCGDLEAAFEQQVGYLIQDCSASIQNMLLAATALGLGSCWVGVYPAEKGMRQVRDLFGLPPTFVPVAVVALGVPGEQPAPRTRYLETNVHAEKW